MVKRTALGKGLGALIEGADAAQQTAAVSEIELSKIEANPFQPRSVFDEEALADLADSIREIGLIQPITLRKIDDNRYQIIAGERRFRAAIMAGLTSLPAFIRKAKDDGMLEMALVENIQREDLNSMEIALSYQRLIEELNYTQEDLSTRVGKKRATIANYLRLLKLPAIIQKGVRDKQITMGHARALITINDSETQIMIFNQIMKYDFSVRKVEEIVRDLIDENNPENPEKPERKSLTPVAQNIKNQLGKIFNSKISLSIDDKGKGRIVIPFKSSEELENIVKIIENQK
jgi:ParB family chromosome partitioning protein